MKKVWNVISSILIAIIMIISIAMTAMVIISTRSEDGIPSLFGYALFNVKTDSMEGPDGFPAGSMIVIRKLSPDQINSELKVGDVITYRRVYEGEQYLDTHRIVPITQDLVDAFAGDGNIKFMTQEIVDGVWIHGSTHYYITKGDHERNIDYNSRSEFEFAYTDNIVGVWTGIRIPVVGKIIEFMQSQLGFMVCIVIPVALFFIYELYAFIVTLTRKKKEEALEEVSSKEEELKKKAIAEFLAQQAASGSASAEAKSEEAAEVKDDKPAEEEKKEDKKDKKDKKKGKKDKEEAKEDEKKEEKKEEPEQEEGEEDTEEDEKEEAKDDKEEDKKEEAKEDDKQEEKEDKKEEKSAADISEEEKARIIQEYLAKQAAEAAEKKD